MKKKFILNKSLRGYPVGYKLSLIVDKTGKPIDRYWADRFEDAKVDDCLSLYKESKSETEESPAIKKQKKKTNYCE